MGEVKRYTLAEVAVNTGRNNSRAWLVYRDSVYDVTSYLEEHPDGPASILEEAGTDCTKAFDEVSHTADARTIMIKYKIGELVEEEKKYDASGKKKKKKRAVTAAPEETSRGFCSIITCGLVG